jgi:hypothetical protein
MKFNSQYFCPDVLPDIQQNICSSSRRKTLKCILLDLDNAPIHNSPLSSEKIESATDQKARHLHSSLDLAQSNFVLFGDLKERLRGTSFIPGDDLIFAMRPLFSDIPEMVLEDVLTNWTARLS